MTLAETDIAAITTLHDTFGLTAREALVLARMATGRVIEHREVVEIYCDKADTSEIEARSAIKRIRQKIAAPPHHWTKMSIISHYGVGYALTPEAAKRIRALLQQRRAA